jgi:uncharacterized protein YecT (DUF1311 family)
MPQINLSTLNGRELRQLLDASRRRGDASLSYQILQEMAARREHPAERGPFMMLRPADRRPAPIELGDTAEAELGDAEEADDVPPMPRWRPPAREPEAQRAAAPAPLPPTARGGRRKKAPPEPVAAEVPEPIDAVAAAPAPAGAVEPPQDAHRPLSLSEPDPQPTPDAAADTEAAGLRLHAERPQPARASRPPRFRMVAGFALGIAVGAVLGWWAAVRVGDSLPTAAAPPAIQTAALTPSAVAAQPVASSAAEPAPVAPPDAAAAAPTADAPAAPIPPANAAPTSAAPTSAQESARDADGKAIEPPPPPPPESQAAETAQAADTSQAAPKRSAPVAAKGCAAEPTPADRTICGEPQLRRLQGELRRAYSDAIAAHQDRALLRERQLAWADARNSVSDPARLAKLYEQRIRKLNAATAAARRER